MPFHVEIRRSLQRARVFNLEEAELRRGVLEPWGRGGPVRLGDQDWDPTKCRLTILQGPALAAPDLSLGQGWNNAERSAQDVTSRLLAPTASARDRSTVAVLATTPDGRDAAAEALARLGLRAVDWAPAHHRILADAMVASEQPPGGAGVAAAIILLEGATLPQSWWFQAGVALGALGGRAIIAQLGSEPTPPELQGLGIVRLGPSPHPLAERLRRAGCEVGPISG